MKTLIATVILFGLGTGLALAEGGGDSNTWIGKSMQQVQRGGHGTQFYQNGEERFIGR
jgi:hypothetical protein